MLKNYFKIAFRNLGKNPFFSFINIFGLAIGIAFVLLIGGYIRSELLVNKNLRHSKNQYFLTSVWKDPNVGPAITTEGPLAKRLKEDYPILVANYYRWDGITSVVTKGDKHFRENIQLGDSTLLSMYGFPLMHGDPRTALNNHFSVVVTPEVAVKYFGRTDVVGETLTIQSFSGSLHDFAITGVLEEIPENSVTKLNDANNNTLFIPANTYAYFGRTDFDSWDNIYLPSYIELKDGVSPKDLEQPIRQLVNQNAPDVIKQNLTVQPVALTDYYLHKNNDLVKRMLYTLSFIALFILLMAVINFINISISSSSGRMKEIGVRKVMGSLRKQITAQFLTESVLLVFLATLLALASYPFLKPLFTQLVGKNLPALSAYPLYFVGVLAAFVLVVGLLAGLYPALVLSSLKTIDSLKGKWNTVKERVTLRKLLVGFQFSIAAIVMIAALIVSQQVAYFFSQNLGYNKDYIVSAQVPRDWSPEGVRKMQMVRNEFARMPQVSEVALSYEIPNGMNGGQPPVYRYGTDSSRAAAMESLLTDGNYLSAYQIPLKAGGFFSTDDSADSLKVVLNEKAVQALGWRQPNEAIGGQIKVPGNNEVFTIKGVTGDFHFGSMQAEIKPAIFFKVTFTKTYRYLSFKLKPGNISNAIEVIQSKWTSLLPGSAFEYNFMDETLSKLYTSELQMKKTAYVATGLALIIVMLGVLGLLSLSIQKRTKEIGIRKVLGASAPGIIQLFLKQFLSVIVLAGSVAIPVALFVMRNWLNNYAYRISLNALPFLLPIFILILITTMLICLQVAKASAANPVKSLRTE